MARNRTRTDAGTDDPVRLREDMLAEVLRRGGTAAGTDVARALLAVPRHAFLPEVPLRVAYRDDAVVTKRDPYGVPVSSSSQPTIMALMLAQLDLAAGHRVLEIGAGTGYNAALIAHLVGAAGSVVSVDLDPDTAARAATALSRAGYPQVQVVAADGARGYPPGAPYDRIIATVGVWDLAPAWLAQLAPAGRIVLPLDLRGAQVSVAFERDGGHWVGRSLIPCGFMRLRGEQAGPNRYRSLDRRAGLGLSLPDDREPDPGLGTALASTPVVRDSGLAGDPGDLAGFGLWLALAEPRWCALTGEGRGGTVLTRALGTRRGYRATVGILAGAGLALLARYPRGDGRVGLAAHGYGPRGDRLAGDLLGHLHGWDAAGRPGTERLHLAAYPRADGTPPPVTPGATVLDKVHTRLVVTTVPAPG